MTDDDPTQGSSSPNRPETHESATGEGHPDRIGPHEILRLLGEGGMRLVREFESRLPDWFKCSNYKWLSD